MSETLRERVRERIEDFVDTFVVEGDKPADILDAIEAEIIALRQAFARDPAPADDPLTEEIVAEPSNDWPAAGGKPRSGGE